MLTELTVNGDHHQVAVEPRATLLELLRYELKQTGSKQGCDKGDCGACTVWVDGRPVLSCLTLALECQGASVTTIEGLANGPEAHPVQEAFDACGALQCGFCQPGMMMSAAALLEKEAKPSRESIRAALAGNLCRCTGYKQIFDAVEVACGKRPLPTVAPPEPLAAPARAPEKP